MKANYTVETYLNYIDGEFYTKDFIQEIKTLVEAVSPEKAQQAYTKNLGIIKKELSKNGIKIAEIANAAKAKKNFYINKIKNYHKRGMTPEKAGMEISRDLGKDLQLVARKAYNKFSALGLVKKVIIALLVFVVILYLNIILGTVVIGILGTKALMLPALIIAPMVEEAAKQYFIRKGMPWTGVTIVFGLELVQYVINITAIGGNITKVIILRLIGLMMHFTTTYIQKKIIEKEKEEGERAFQAWMTGVIIHAAFNAFGLAYNSQIMMWATR